MRSVSRKVHKRVAAQLRMLQRHYHSFQTDLVSKKLTPVHPLPNKCYRSADCLLLMERNFLLRHSSLKCRASIICTIGSAFAAFFIVPFLFTRTKSNSRRKSAPLQVFSRDKQGVDACIIPDVCIHASKKLHRVFVPSSHRNSTRLLKRCLRKDVSIGFYDQNYPHSAFRAALQKKDEFDVLGVPIEDSYFSHFPHFALELIRHIAVPASFFQNQMQMRPYCANGNTFASCEYFVSPTLKPRMSLSLGILSGTASHWKCNFVSMFAKGSMHNLHLEKVRPHSTADAAYSLVQGPTTRCFKSMLSSPHPYNSNNPEHYSLLSSSGLSNRIRNNEVVDGRCKVHIVIITRDANRKMLNKPVDRTIPRQVLQRLIIAISEKLVEDSLHFGSVEVVTGLGNYNFSEQVAIMQRADVLVSVHGAELANAVFLRRGISVVEIFPFGYHLPYFNSLLSAVGVNHVPVFAPPDLQRYSYCMQFTAFLKFPHMALIWGNRVANAFRKKAREFEKAENQTGKDKAADFYSSYFIGRYCARTQRIFVDPTRLARIVVKEASRLCT